ncbi:MAG: FeoC-like transcriptional regulator [Clostridiales bacterium]|jgi:predicted transcriptional regulator|nr:FeoC-like transcriptional regulator [Clostridiales bacterium]
MLKDILMIIDRDRKISRSHISRELNIEDTLVDDGISQLIRMGFILEEAGADCVVACSNCPFIKSCQKEIVKIFQISQKGKDYLAQR